MSWKNYIEQEMAKHGENFSDVEYTTLTDREMSAYFDPGFGAPNGVPFTLWTTHRVYFPVVYDGAEWAGSVPRNPSNEATKHHGGGC